METARIEAQLGLDVHVAREVAENEAALAKALVQAAIADPHSRAMTHVLERTLGKVAERVELQGNSNPFEMDEAELAAWLREDD